MRKIFKMLEKNLMGKRLGEKMTHEQNFERVDHLLKMNFLEMFQIFYWNNMESHKWKHNSLQILLLIQIFLLQHGYLIIFSTEMWSYSCHLLTNKRELSVSGWQNKHETEKHTCLLPAIIFLTLHFTIPWRAIADKVCD